MRHTWIDVLAELVLWCSFGLGGIFFIGVAFPTDTGSPPGTRFRIGFLLSGIMAWAIAYIMTKSNERWTQRSIH